MIYVPDNLIRNETKTLILSPVRLMVVNQRLAVQMKKHTITGLKMAKRINPYRENQRERLPQHSTQTLTIIRNKIGNVQRGVNVINAHTLLSAEEILRLKWSFFADFLYNEVFHWTDYLKSDQWYQLILFCTAGLQNAGKYFAGKVKEKSTFWQSSLKLQEFFKSECILLK